MYLLLSHSDSVMLCTSIDELCVASSIFVPVAEVYRPINRSIFKTHQSCRKAEKPVKFLLFRMNPGVVVLT